MAVPERRDMVNALQKQLGREVPVFWDIQHKGPGPNARVAWQALARQGDHALLIQEDVSVCKRFLEAVDLIVSLLPDMPISFFRCGKEIPGALAKGSHWVQQPHHFLGAQALLQPSEHALKMSYWRSSAAADIHDDVLFREYNLKVRGLHVQCTAPCLVEHLIGRSAMKHTNQTGGKTVTAGVFIGAGDPMEIDWTKGIYETQDQAD